jgi:hypothetical protein
MNLTISDLATMANVIDIATQRGAFRGNELKPIGELYEKLTEFVKMAQEQARKEEEAAAGAATPAAANQSAAANAPGQMGGFEFKKAPVNPPLDPGAGE